MYYATAKEMEKLDALAVGEGLIPAFLYNRIAFGARPLFDTQTGFVHLGTH